MGRSVPVPTKNSAGAQSYMLMLYNNDGEMDGCFRRCMELHFWRQRDERLDRSWTEYRRAMKRPSWIPRASVFYQKFGAGTAIDCQQGQSQTPTQQLSTRPSAGSRSDRSTLGRLRWLGELLVESLEGRRRFQCRVAPVTAGSVVSARSLGEKFSRGS
jgi:hypothetical protein